MIFLAGVHGVGKSTLAEKIEGFGIRCYRASEMIEAGADRKMPVNKEIGNIEENQKVLEQEMGRVLKKGGVTILEGHLCLIDDGGHIVKIPRSTFERLCPEAVWVLVDDAEVIAGRNSNKSSLLSSAEFVSEFQKQELAYGKEIADYLDIPFDRIDSQEDGINKIRAYVRERTHCDINTFGD